MKINNIAAGGGSSQNAGGGGSRLNGGGGASNSFQDQKWVIKDVQSNVVRDADINDYRSRNTNGDDVLSRDEITTSNTSNPNARLALVYENRPDVEHSLDDPNFDGIHGLNAIA